MEDAANKAAADKTKVANFILSDSLEMKRLSLEKLYRKRSESKIHREVVK